MIKIIYSITLMIFLIAVSFSIANAQKPSRRADVFKNIEKFAHQPEALQAQILMEAKSAKAKSEAGIDKMCLALDLREAELTVIDAINDPEIEIEAIQSIDLLLYHLEGTPEGDRLIELLSDEATTMEDYSETLAQVEQSLRKQLKGEQLWTFSVGLSLSDVYYEAAYGNEGDLHFALAKLQKLVVEASNYVSDEEVEILKNIARYFEKAGLSDEDYLDIQAGLTNFVTVYFENA